MRTSFAFCSLFAIASAWGSEQVTLGEAYSVLVPAPPSQSEKMKPSGISGRVPSGYQGWFRAVGDGSDLGFHHYGKQGKFEPGHCTIDLWPDLSEFDENEKYATPFQHADGSVAKVFSSLNATTVDRHFKWMRDFNLDGVFVQRFASLGAKEHPSFRHLQADNRKSTDSTLFNPIQSIIP